MNNKQERFNKGLGLICSGFSEIMQVKKEIKELYNSVKFLENSSDKMHAAISELGDTLQSLTIYLDKMGDLIDDFKDLDLSKI